MPLHQGLETIRLFSWQALLLTDSNLKARYRKTLAGFVWVVFNPILRYLVQYLVFGHFLRLPIPNYALYLLTGLLPWIFVTQSIEMCTSQFLTQGRLIRSLPVHPLVYILAQVLDCLVSFLAAFGLIAIVVFSWYGYSLERLWLVPLVSLPIIVGTVGLCWLLATLQVFFRDTRFLVSFFLQVLFFLTPIFYSEELVTPEYRWLFDINVIYQFMIPFRYTLFDYQPALLLSSVLHSSAIALTFVGLAVLLWRQKKTDLKFHV